MAWNKQSENLYTHSEAPFVIVKQSDVWYLIDTRDQSKAIPIDDIFNNPVFSINFENQTVRAAHFRGEGLNTPATPAHSFKTEINSGLYLESSGVLAISSLGTKVLTIDQKPSFLCKAWVNFNGTGAVSIRASGNVSSITDNGTGDYTVNFTTAMPDANYCPVSISSQTNLGNYPWSPSLIVSNSPFSVNSLKLLWEDTSNGNSIDVEFACVAVFR